MPWHEVAALRAKDEVQVQARVPVQQQVQARRHQVLGRGQRRMDAYRARDFGIGHAHTGLGLLHGLHHALAGDAKVLAFLGQAYGSGNPLEQPHAKACLHARDELAHRRRR